MARNMFLKLSTPRKAYWLILCENVKSLRLLFLTGKKSQIMKLLAVKCPVFPYGFSKLLTKSQRKSKNGLFDGSIDPNALRLKIKAEFPVEKLKK